ncbi:ABC transporter ATP-binding protein, partial [Gemmiger sp.]|uniref:ABC transporter ATP-binding protein n=1 Tax=Gemmiger sp. TaxID=2049027 RepID=UPI003AB345BF
KNLKLERTFVPYNMLQQIILYGTSILVIVEGLYFYLNGTMALSICLLMTVASFMLFSQLQSAGNTSALLRLLDVSIDKVNEIDKTPVMDEHGKPVKPENYNIVFDDVSFSYGEHQVLDHVSLTIPERTVTAIVGPSGAGKSTLCNLIARFWDVDGGKITIGGVDVRDYTLDSLLTNISEVFQKVYLFADTIENNIKFGNPAAPHEEVVKAAQKACCHEFIMSLPDGYGTVIGEGGATLSGGEKQRISIARAILKDAPIIILDEATSSVDPENENLLMGAIAELTKNKTVIMIAHRLKTVRNADQIFVLSGGHIVQTGKHEDLIRQPGIYADFIGIRKKAIGWKLK